MSDLRQKMLAVMDDVNSGLAEREELVECIAIALLTRKNLFILGDAGQGKSFAINQFRARITGARQFERLLTKQTDEDQLFGRVDMSTLIPGALPASELEHDATYQNLLFSLKCLLEGVGSMPDTPETWEAIDRATGRAESYRKLAETLYQREPRVLTDGKIPESDIVFLDELFKCNDGVLNSLLTALNERKYTNEGATYPIPTISFFAASNEVPNFSDPQERILLALYDRLDLKVITENITERDHRLQMLKKKQTGSAEQIHATMTLDELKDMQAEVAAIPVPDAVNELTDDILCELRKAGVRVSDRKFLNYAPVAQAKAWLSGHKEVTAQDLLALKNYLWDLPKDRALVETTLSRMCINPMQDKVDNIRGMAAEARDEFDAARGETDKPNAGSKALIKLRGELIRLYRMQQQLAESAQSWNETSMTDALLADLEQISRQAHEAVGFTYMPLAEQAALQ